MELRLDIENGKPLLGTVNYKNQQLSNQPCSLYQEPDFLEKLDYIITEFKKQIDTDVWYWNNYHEIIDLNFFNKIGIFDYFEKKFNRNLKILDNNVGIGKSGHPYFLGMTNPTRLKIHESKHIEKTFLCMNLHEKPHRTEIFNLFKDTNLFSKSFFSYLHYDISHRFHKRLPSEENFELEIPRDILPCYKPEYKPIEEHKKSFCSIVTETLFYENDVNGLMKDSMFITEKTEKCFSAGHPFVMVARPYFLKKLKEYGFKTFSNWWDESYDEEIDDEKRMDKIKNTIIEISLMNDDQIKGMYIDMIDILKHNQKVNEEWYLKNKKICSTQFLNHECEIKSIYINI